MRYLTTFIITLFIGSSFCQQALIWSDDFNGTAADWDLTIQTGTNGVDANVWKITDEEGGVTPPGCAVSGNGDNTLHIACQGAFCPQAGAIYNFGDGGVNIAAETNRRAAYLVPISTMGETNLEFVFDWIGVGQTGIDFAEAEYSIDGGATWVVFWTQSPGATCGPNVGEWAEQTVPLPVAVENQADLRFAFHWRNNEDGNGQMPSFAVNNLRLYAEDLGPNANFTASSYNICEGECIGFSDNSTGSNISSWDWSFTGAVPTTSTDQNPTNVCYATAGSYDVTLTVTDDNGTESNTQTITVAACPGDPPVADFVTDTSIICAGDCISFTDSTESEDPLTWQWIFQGGDPSFSTEQNPSGVCFDTVGNFDITLIVSNINGSDTVTKPLTVLELPEVFGYGDTLIDIGGAAVLNGYHSDPGEFFWRPAEHLDCDTCLEVIATPYITTTYFPSLTGLNGCTGQDTVVVAVNFEEIVEVPSAFSPNGDGLNDFIYVKGIGITRIDFKIFNRYGQLVFTSKKLDNGWDGTFNGEPLNQGVFVYTLEFDLINGQSGERTGNITLVK